MRTNAKQPKNIGDDVARLPILLTQEEAAAIVGIPYSTMRKAFMPEGKRPAYIKNPPPHTYLGSSPRIYADKLNAWAMSLGDMRGVRRRGRPTNRARAAATTAAQQEAA